MVDPTVKETADKAYGFWNEAGAWVGSHPKTTIAIAAAIILVVVVLL